MGRACRHADEQADEQADEPLVHRQHLVDERDGGAAESVDEVHVHQRGAAGDRMVFRQLHAERYV